MSSILPYLSPEKCPLAPHHLGWLYKLGVSGNRAETEFGSTPLCLMAMILHFIVLTLQSEIDALLTGFNCPKGDEFGIYNASLCLLLQTFSDQNHDLA